MSTSTYIVVYFSKLKNAFKSSEVVKLSRVDNDTRLYVRISTGSNWKWLRRRSQTVQRTEQETSSRSMIQSTDVKNKSAFVQLMAQ